MSENRRLEWPGQAGMGLARAGGVSPATKSATRVFPSRVSSRFSGSMSRWYSPEVTTAREDVASELETAPPIVNAGAVEAL